MLARLFPRVLLAIALAATYVVTSSAQTVEGVDAGRLRAAAKVQGEAAKAFADEVARRGEALRDSALATARGAEANRVRATSNATTSPRGAMDLDAMVAQADAARAGPGNSAGPRLIVFASTSMPAASLAALVKDVTKSGGVVVFQGFPDNSPKAFGAAILRFVAQGQSTRGIGIDPRLFRAFNVTVVPTYVVASRDFDLCDGFSCVTAIPPHDRMAGNVTTDYALAQFAAGGGPGAAAARGYLARLRKGSGG